MAQNQNYDSNDPRFVGAISHASRASKGLNLANFLRVSSLLWGLKCVCLHDSLFCGVGEIASGLTSEFRLGPRRTCIGEPELRLHIIGGGF